MTSQEVLKAQTKEKSSSKNAPSTVTKHICTGKVLQITLMGIFPLFLVSNVFEESLYKQWLI